MIKIGNFLFKYRNYLFPVIFFLLLILTKPETLIGNIHLNKWIDVFGMMVALSGEMLRISVVGFAYIKRGGKNKKVYAEDLVQRGFFGICRNPLYLGNILIFIGITIIVNSRWFYICIPFIVFFYYAIVIAEEDFLRKKFGKEYENYCKMVNRFLPDLTKLRKAIEGIPFNWKRVISAEYGTFFAGIYTTIFLIVWKECYFWGYSSKRILYLIYFYIIITTAYLITRYLKKSGSFSS